MHISDIGSAIDSVQNNQAVGWVNTHRGIGVALYRQPGANVIATADRVKVELPRLLASVPPAIHVEIIADRTVVIRASVRSVEETLLIAVALVVLVIFVLPGGSCGRP